MNKNYMKYLIRSWKVTVIFFAALFFGLAATPMINSYDSASAYRASLEIMSIEAAALTFILPVLLFSFAHRRRSADLFFSLPVSRMAQLITNLVFAFCTIYGFFLITSLLLWIPYGNHVFPFAGVLAINATAALTIAALLLVHSCWYLIANNIFDGIVMIASWSFLPLLIYVVVNSFADNMIAGQNGTVLGDICMWLSPLAMGVRNMFELSSWPDVDVKLYYDILLALWALVGAAGLYWHFVRRKSERAEQLSDDPLAYPFIINVYALGILVIMACELVHDASLSFITLYLILLFIYVVAQFVYNRKIRLTKKIFITFGALTLISLIFAQAAFRTRGFGLGNRFSLDQGTNMRIDYSAVVDKDDISRLIIRDDTGIKYDYEQEAYVNFTLYMPDSEYENNPMLKEMMNRYREDSISLFYSQRKNLSRNARINFMNSNRSYNFYTNNYYYPLDKAFSLEDLKFIDSLPYGDVLIQSNDMDKELSLSQWLARKGN